MAKLHILVDLDGVCADIEAGFLEKWLRSHPQGPIIPISQRDTFYIQDQYSREFGSRYRHLVDEVMTAPGFFRDLAPMPRVKSAIKAIRDYGHTVTICTAPMRGHLQCLQEKFDWVRGCLEKDIAANMVIANDKRLFRGDILLDDRPEIKGTLEPTWEHVLFDAPYNRGVTGKRRVMDWNDAVRMFCPKE